MFCAHCGNQIPDDAQFCPQCGRPAADRSEGSEEVLIGLRMTPGQDGVFRWFQKADLWTNASKLPLVLGCTGAVALMFFIPMGLDTGLLAGDPLGAAALILLLTGGAMLAAALIYLAGALLIGKSYLLLYELGPTKLRTGRKLSKKQDIRWTSAGLAMAFLVDFPYKIDMLNLMTDHIAEVRLDSVRSIRRKKGAVRLYGSFGFCRVYADENDIDPLLQFLNAHCPNLKTIS